MNQAPLIVSVSGIRGIVGASLTPEVACTFAGALGTFLQGQPVVVGRDGRPSGNALGHAVLAGLLGAGCRVHDLGIAATPTVGLAIQKLHAAGGIQITASHNPAEWNGLKLFGPAGEVLTAGVGKEVQAVFETRALQRAAWNAVGQVQGCRDANPWHRDRVLALIGAGRARGFRVLLDANGGAGGPLGVSLLEALGCTVLARGCEADGHFLHVPEPTAENVREIGPLVVQHQAALGCVLDPDADRLALLDEQGNYIGEEMTLALAVLYRLNQERGPVVINMSTSRLVEDIAARFECPCYRSAVGEANVVELMRAHSAVIGGEGNGGVIDPRVGGVRDPFIGLGLILSLLVESGKPLSELVAGLPAYHIQKDKIAVPPQRLPALYAALEQRWPEARVNRLDGLRLDWPDRWVHVRPSNTEPIARVIAEAPQPAATQELCAAVGQLL